MRAARAGGPGGPAAGGRAGGGRGAGGWGTEDDSSLTRGDGDGGGGGGGDGRGASAPRGRRSCQRVCLRIAARLGAQPALPDWTQTGAQPLAAARQAFWSSRRRRCRLLSSRSSCRAQPTAAPRPGGARSGRRAGWAWSEAAAGRLE